MIFILPIIFLITYILNYRLGFIHEKLRTLSNTIRIVSPTHALRPYTIVKSASRERLFVNTDCRFGRAAEYRDPNTKYYRGYISRHCGKGSSRGKFLHHTMLVDGRLKIYLYSRIHVEISQ